MARQQGIFRGSDTSIPVFSAAGISASVIPVISAADTSATDTIFATRTFRNPTGEPPS